MSRIGNKIIKIPQGVQISVEDAKVTVKGPKGELKQDIFEKLDVNQKDDELIIVRHSDDKDTKAQHGLARALIANMVEGVSKGFEKKLEIQGVEANGFLARVLQHEIDHCNGIVFVDHIRDDHQAFYRLNDEGELDPLDYERYVKDNADLWD